jgi:hypothetical protein
VLASARLRRLYFILPPLIPLQKIRRKHKRCFGAASDGGGFLGFWLACCGQGPLGSVLRFAGLECNDLWLLKNSPENRKNNFALGGPTNGLSRFGETFATPQVWLF